MDVLVVIFGGVDTTNLNENEHQNLLQETSGEVHVDKLWRERDVATQITSQFITGESWRMTGITGRKKYIDEQVERIEKDLIRSILPRSGYLGGFEYQTRPFREGIYSSLGLDTSTQNYTKNDIEVPTVFEEVPDSKAIYVPSYNPEPSWAIRRNILNPTTYTDFGEEGAVDLAEKNLNWHKKKLFEHSDTEHTLLMTQFQYLDSMQHLYSAYTHDPEKVEQAYVRMDALAGQIKSEFDGYDLTLFISDNGTPTSEPSRTHHNRPFYSVDRDLGLPEKKNMREFYDLIINWTEK
jgi:hypothetical protein